MSQSPQWLIVTKDIINIIFWFANITFFVITTAIGIKTYKSAKRTLLQPIKTEVFKEQIKEYSKILNFFSAKDETSLQNEFAFDKLFRANTIATFDQYAITFFDYKPNLDEKPYSSEKCPSKLVTQEGMEKHFRRIDDHMTTEVAVTKEKPDSRVRAALWAEYKCTMLHIPREMKEKNKELELLKSSPLLSKQLVELIEEFEESLRLNKHMLMDVLTEVSKEFVRKYPSPESLSKMTYHWIWNKLNKKLLPLEEPAHKIIEYIRDYYKVDELID